MLKKERKKSHMNRWKQQKNSAHARRVSLQDVEVGHHINEELVQCPIIKTKLVPPPTPPAPNPQSTAWPHYHQNAVPRRFLFTPYHQGLELNSPLMQLRQRLLTLLCHVPPTDQSTRSFFFSFWRDGERMTVQQLNF